MEDRIYFTEEQRKFLYDLRNECKKHEHCTQCKYFSSCSAIDCFTPDLFFETDLEATYFLDYGRRLIL